MKIAMFTNTYLPHVGGVARSVQTLADACREQGHEVGVIAPEFEGAEPSPHVIRVPAIQNFNGSDFSVQLPFQGVISEFISGFKPDLIHSHHPFLLGDSALRVAWKAQLPLVFTHHTLYERYTHYVPMDSPALKRMAVQLATEYCNRCDQVIAPSQSIQILLQEREVTAPIEVIPTGIDTAHFATGDGTRFRDRYHIPSGARVIGHVGRLAAEKNLRYLAEAVLILLKADPALHMVVVGTGPARGEMLALLQQAGHPHRIHAPGTLTGGALADAYAAMDCFVFASQSETQGLVIAEAMAAGNPVVALDAPGVREVVRNGHNGRLLPAEALPGSFATALAELLGDPDILRTCAVHAVEDAAAFDTGRCVRQVLECYQKLLSRPKFAAKTDPSPWDRFLTGITIEWEMFTEKTAAVAAAVIETPATKSSLK
jgi:1,2-diacylglycerol 3-alpha-glucosyltransferase